MDTLQKFNIDLNDLKQTVDKSKDLKSDEAFFSELSKIAIAKHELELAIDELISLDQIAKQMINNKAKSLYGDDWQVIESDKFKILRSPTGATYEISDQEAAKLEYLTVKFTVNAKEVDRYREAADNKLPDGIALNPKRGQTIGITLK